MKEKCCANTVSVNYEAEYLRQREIIMELSDENKRLKDMIIGMCESLYAKGGRRNDYRA